MPETPGGPEIARSPNRRPVSGVLLVAALGVLGLLASTLGATGGATAPSLGAPVATLLLYLPEALLSLLLLVGLVVLGYVVALLRPRRPRRSKEPEHVQERPPLSWGTRLVLAGLALVLVAAVVAMFAIVLTHPETGIATGPTARAGHPMPSPSAVRASPHQGGASLPSWWWMAPVLVVATCVALALILWLRSRTQRTSGFAPGIDRRAAVEQAIAESLEVLRSDPDPRRAVLRAYLSMEGTLTNAGLRRHFFETAEEYVRRVLIALDIDGNAPRTLAELFSLARFSHHRIDEAARQRAIDALATVQAGLRT